MARTYQSTPFVRAKPGNEKGRGGPEKWPQGGRGTGGVRCVCVCASETPRPERPCIQAARVAAGEPSVRPASPTSHLPLRRRALLRVSRCPGKLGSAPGHPACIPCGLRPRGKVKLGGTLHPTGTLTHHRDMAARSRAAERGARITALGSATRDGGTKPGRAPAETFFFACGWRRSRRGGGPGRLTLRAPAHRGDSNSV